MPSKLQPGMVLGAVEPLEFTMGTVKPEPGYQSVCVFLGTVPEQQEEVDVPAIMRGLGWSRSTVLEVAVQFTDGHVTWTHMLNYLAESPKEGAMSALRFARRMHEEELKKSTCTTLLALTLRTMRLGPIDDEGVPTNGRGAPILGWIAKDSTLDEFEQKIKDQ